MIGNKRIITVVGIFILFAVSIVAISHQGGKVTNGVRGFIYGEGQWTKAQKQGVIALQKLIHTENLIYYEEFEEALLVNEGDRVARETLISENPDLELAREGFLQGKNHPEDIEQMIWVLQRFQNMELIRRAINIWIEGDEKIEELRELAAQIYESIQSNELSDDEIKKYTDGLIELDDELTELEVNFSTAMSEAARQATNIVISLIISVTLILTIIVSFLTVSFYRSLKQANEKLAESEKKFRNVLDHSRDVIYQFDINTEKYIYMSPSIKDITGYSIDELTKGGISLVLDNTHPDDYERMNNEAGKYSNNSSNSNFQDDTQFRFKRKDGNYIWINNKRTLLKDEDEVPVAVIGNVRDISDRMNYIDALDESLKEKDMLLSEIHHRVKNNLSIVSSLVELQKNKDGEVSEEDLNEIQSRIKSIAMVHEKLYKNNNFADVDLALYLSDLVDMIYDTYDSKSRNITILKNLDSVIVNIKKAVPIGLICNELLNNCYKYAFEDMNQGVINIDLSVNETEATLRVYDNGVGLPEKLNDLNSDSLGMTLVRVFTEQIQGKLEYETNAGAKFSIKFDLKNNI
jgi:PAS domain S-box-containing protein